MPSLFLKVLTSVACSSSSPGAGVDAPHRDTVDLLPALLVVHHLIIADLDGPVSESVHESGDVGGGVPRDLFEFLRGGVRVLPLDAVRAVRRYGLKSFPCLALGGVDDAESLS